MDSGTGTVNIELFLDSVTSIGSVAYPVRIETNSSKMAVGTERDATNHPGGESYDGEMVRLLIYERPLSDAEMKQNIESMRAYYLEEPVVTLNPSSLPKKHALELRGKPGTYDALGRNLRCADMAPGCPGRGVKIHVGPDTER